MPFSGTRKSTTIASLAAGLILGIAVTSVAVFFLTTAGDREANAEQSGVQPLASNAKTGSIEKRTSLRSIAELSELNTDFERDTALYRLLRRANESRLKGFLEEAQELESYSQEAVRAIIQKLASLNPDSAMEQIGNMPESWQPDLVSSIYEEWSLANLDKAVEEAMKLDSPLKKAALQGILVARGDLSAGMLQAIGKQLEHEQYATDFLGESAVLSALSDPQAVWNQLIQDNQPDFAQTDVLIDVASEWLTQAGISAIDQISESLSDVMVRNAVVASVLHQFAQEDPRAALFEALNLQGNSRELALQTIAEVWATIDAEVALAGIATMESEATQGLLQAVVLKTWAASDPSGLLDSVELLDEDLRELAKKEALLAMARQSPQDAVAFLSELEDRNLRDSLAKEIATYWSENDPHAALDWALQDQFSSDVQQAEVLMIVLANLASRDPDLAFKTARGQPIALRGQYYRGLEVTVLEHLVETNIDKALSMLSGIRSEGLTRTHAYSEVGRAMMRDGQFDRALKLGEQLDERRRRNYNGSIMYQWALSEPEALLQSMEGLATDQLKEQAAKGLLRFNPDTKALSQEQIEYVESFLSEEYVARMNQNKNVERVMGRISDASVISTDGAVQVIFLNAGALGAPEEPK